MQINVLFSIFINFYCILQLTESKVFTASTVHDESSSKAFSNSDLIADGDNNLFSSAQTQSLNEQVFAPASSLGGEPLTRTDAVGYQKQQQQQPYKDLQAGSSQNQLGQRWVLISFNCCCVFQFS